MDLQNLLNRASDSKKKGEFIEALKFYSRAFDILISEASSYSHSKGDSFLDSEENGKKISKVLPKHFEYSKEYLKKNNIAAVISNNMGTILAEMSDFEGAKKMFEQAIELTPDREDYSDPKIGLKELKKIFNRVKKYL